MSDTQKPIEVTIEKTAEPAVKEDKPAEQTNVTLPDVPAKESSSAAKWDNPHSFEGASFGSTVVNIVNTVIGAGVLSIAFSIRQAGILGSIILIILVLIPSYITTYYLASATVYTNEYMNVLFKQIVDICTELFNIGEFMNKNKTVCLLCACHA